MDVLAKIQRAALVDAAVLVLGASGTARNVVAQMLHYTGPRKNGPFVVVNCAGVPTRLAESELLGFTSGTLSRHVGAFSQADGGTLFLDEITHLSPEIQDMLLRVLESSMVRPVGGFEDRRVDVRVVSGASRDIASIVREGLFREDLYYRLNVVTVDLRDAPDDR